ncbi:MAG: phosphatase PAP2 family protein, partial [Nitrosopumilus sp.]|nr:phosphatase PAP2 family protein [Nitrosopumilus sp.]
MQNWIFNIRSRSFVLLTILFLIITAIVYSGLTESFDQSVILFFSENVGNTTLDIVMQYVTE